MSFPVEIARAELEPRNLRFWEKRLNHARQEILRLEKLVSHPATPKACPKRPNRRMTPTERVAYRKALRAYQEFVNGKRQVRRHLRMLRETKIPYYESRILALRRTWWQRLGDDSFQEAEA